MMINGNIFKRYIITFFIVVYSAIFLNLFAESDKLLISSNPNYFATETEEAIAAMVSRYMEKIHFSKTSIDERISEILFEEYFEKLDPGKYFFLESDISSFEKKYKKNLHLHLKSGNIDFAFEVYNLFLKRVTERYLFVKERIQEDFDFTLNEYYNVDRKDSSFASSETEQNEIWRKRIKNNYLLYLIIEESMNKKDKEGKLTEKELEVKKDKELFNTKTPKQRVVKLYQSQLKRYKSFTNEDILEKYLSTLTNIFDIHSTYMSPKTIEDFNIQMSLSLQGIGANLTTDDGFIKITRIVPGGPAYKDGRLKSGDRIIAVAQEGKEHEELDVIDMPLDKAVRFIRGEKGTTVILTIIDGSKGLGSVPVKIALVRDKVELDESAVHGEIKTTTHKISSKSNGVNLKIGVISVPSFYADFKALNNNDKEAKVVTNDVIKELEKMNKENIDGLIIDLRSNGGGSLSEAVNLTGLFFDDGPVVQVSDGIENKTPKVRYDYDGKTYYDGPLVVLVNKFSASASEIFAGAIQDYDRGIIVGDEQTHGKGTVQTILDLKRAFSYNPEYKDKEVGVIKLTIQKFYRVTGSSTQKKGVSSDIVFPSYLDVMEVGEQNLDHVLKWDLINEVDGWDNEQITINKELMVNNNLFKTNLSKIKERSLNRMKTDENFISLKDRIDKFKIKIDNKNISLNKETRAMEKEESENTIEEQAILISGGNRPIEEIEEDKKADANGKEKPKDLYLIESLNIIGDLIELENAMSNE